MTDTTLAPDVLADLAAIPDELRALETRRDELSNAPDLPLFWKAKLALKPANVRAVLERIFVATAQEPAIYQYKKDIQRTAAKARALIDEWESVHLADLPGPATGVDDQVAERLGIPLNDRNAIRAAARGLEYAPPKDDGWIKTETHVVLRCRCGKEMRPTQTRQGVKWTCPIHGIGPG